MVFQSYALWPHMTVAKNVAFGLERRKLCARRDRPQGRRRAGAGRPHGVRRPPARRSSRAASSSAWRWRARIVIEPEVLLLDEPLSNLDAKLRVEMRAELRTLQRKLGITAIYVTHDQEEANADRRPHRGARPGPHPADRHADRALRPSGQPLRRDLPRHRQPDRGPHRAGRPLRPPTGLSLAGIGGPAGPACISIRPQDVAIGPPTAASPPPSPSASSSAR